MPYVPVSLPVIHPPQPASPCLTDPLAPIAAPIAALASDPLAPTIFHETWWLDAAAPGGWGETTVRAGGKVVGRLPYLLRPARLGGDACLMPDFCHFLGPAVDAGTGAPANRALRRDQIIRDLITALPPHGLFHQRMHRDTPDVMIFAEEGFHTLAQFTFEISPAPPDRLWAAMRDKTRNIVRRAEDRYRVTDCLTAAAFAAFYAENAAATGTACYYHPDAITRITDAALARDRGRLLAALTPEGMISAAIFCVWDAKVCYYLLSMRDRGAENGATSLLLWDAIRHAAAQGLVFDFDGLLTRGNRVFYTGFGGTVRPRFVVRRQSLRHRLVLRAGLWATGFGTPQKWRFRKDSNPRPAA